MLARYLGERRVFFGRRAHVLYELIGWNLRHDADLCFMNYGYDDGALRTDLAPADEAERYCAHLYQTVAGQADLTGKRVLDIGSGRGGGASYMQRYLGPRETVGVDRSHQATGFCRRVHARVQGLSFVRGDAMALPFGAGAFDVVTNVESAHCYTDRAAFLAAVARVLRPGGRFLFADFTPLGIAPAAAIDDLVAELAAAGLAPGPVSDITPGILRGLESDETRRRREIGRRFPPGTRRLARLWAGLPGSTIYRDFAEGRRIYLMLCATRAAG